MPGRPATSTTLRHSLVVLIRSTLVVAPVGLALAPACNSDDSSGGTGGTAADGGSSGTGGTAEAGMCLPDSGPAPAAEPDKHCIDDDGGMIVGEANICPDAALDPDAGMEPLPGGHEGTEADDDDCKYHVKYSVTCVAKGQPVTFTVTLTSRDDGSPVTGANPKTLEGFLGTSHILPNSPTPVASEVSPGVYTIGPAVFDQSGQWTVRFHFFETCTDIDGSKHGHAAFLIDVP